MLKLTVAILAVALAASAGAEGWRSLRVDASSEDSFKESVALLQDKLSPSRRHAFDRALQEIWTQGTRKASAEQREYTSADYFAQLDGLSYDDVVHLPDPTGDKAKRYRAEYYYARGGGGFAGPGANWGTRPAGGWGTNPQSIAQGMQACGCMSPNGPQGN
jgi:hypothetical protein